MSAGFSPPLGPLPPPPDEFVGVMALEEGDVVEAMLGWADESGEPDVGLNETVRFGMGVNVEGAVPPSFSGAKGDCVLAVMVVREGCLRVRARLFFSLLRFPL